jgi:hypothetical protein
VGVVGVPSGGIELVLKQISLPVAQIRVMCKNVPQVSMTNKMTFFPKGKMDNLCPVALVNKGLINANLSPVTLVNKGLIKANLYPATHVNKGLINSKANLCPVTLLNKGLIKANLFLFALVNKGL